MSILRNIDNLIKEVYIPNEEPPNYIKRNKQLPSNSKIKEFNDLLNSVDRNIKNRNVGEYNTYREQVSALKSFIDVYEFKTRFDKGTYKTLIKYTKKERATVDNNISEIYKTLNLEKGYLTESHKQINLNKILKHLYGIYSI